MLASIVKRATGNFDNISEKSLNAVKMLDLKRDYCLISWESCIIGFRSLVFVTIVVLLTLLLLWRLWRFTVVPFLWPSEPKPLPYWIPFVGRYRFEIICLDSPL